MTQEQKIRRKKKKRRRQLVLCLELLCVLCIAAFGFGSLTGKHLAQKPVSRSEAKEPAKERNTEQQAPVWEKPEEVMTEKEIKRGQPDHLLLVNKENKLPADYAPVLVMLPDGIHQSAKEAYKPLNAMLKAGNKEGLNFVVCSAYRDQERQEELFQEDLNSLIKQGYSYQEAYDEVAKSTMPPGCSEHSTGLAFDIVALDYQMLDEGQERTEENKWLREHCAEYGFILRYPQDKEDITGVSYESWHFRYVGQEAAEYIMEQGITLEEYLLQER